MTRIKMTDIEHLAYEATFAADDLMVYIQANQWSSATDTIEDIIENLKYLQALIEEKKK